MAKMRAGYRRPAMAKPLKKGAVKQKKVKPARSAGGSY